MCRLEIANRSETRLPPFRFCQVSGLLTYEAEFNMHESQYSARVDLWFLLLGWVLGLLSALISRVLPDIIKKHSDKKKLEIGIFTELKELKFRLAIIVFQIISKYGTLDKDLLNWLRPLVEESKGSFSKDLLDPIEKLLKFDDDHFKKLNEYTKLHAPSALSLKKYHLPFLDSKISELSLFDIEFQNRIFEIRTQINFLNQEVEHSKFLYEKTFDSTLNQENHKIIHQNLTNIYRHISTTARVIIDLISKLAGRESNFVNSKSGTPFS